VPEVHGLSSKNHFGHDLASAQAAYKVLLADLTSDISALTTTRQAGSKQPVGFPVRNTFVESFWNRTYIQSVESLWQRTSRYRRGGFTEQTGTIRDVIQNHLFQVLSIWLWNHLSF